MANIQSDLQTLALAKQINVDDALLVSSASSLICDDKNCSFHNGNNSINSNIVNNSSSKRQEAIKSNCKIADSLLKKSASRPQSGAILQHQANLTSNSNSRLDYKSGAVYDGKVKDNLKSGSGTFIWPNGDKYIGDFKANYRHGLGIQLWDDGSKYEGSFDMDRRSGQGVYRSVNGDTYNGDWFCDFRHGQGEYLWKDTNIYKGMFFKNNREGYGTLMYSSGDVFAGLYKNDIRFGPGVLKYPNDKEDVGYWIGDKLIRLIVSANVNFNFNYDVDEVDKKVEIKSWYDRESLLDETLNPQNIFLNRLTKTRDNAFIKNDPYVEKILEKNIAFYDEYFNSFEKFVSVNDKEASKTKNSSEYRKNLSIKVENITPNLLEVLKYYKRFKMFHKQLFNIIKFNIVNFEKEKRDEFAQAGIIESCSIELLDACYSENLAKVKELKNYVNLDVCDNKGYSPIIIAVLKCNSTIINYLLDNGANINHLLDNGLSALMICIIRYYTNDKFLPNIALKHQDLTITRKLNPDSLVVPTDDELQNSNADNYEDEVNTIGGESTKASEFESENSVVRFKLNVTENIVNKYVDIMSKNENVDGSMELIGSNILKRTSQLHFLNEINEIIELLLRRGADPSLCSIPYPALCFAVASGDVKVVKLLLEKGADCNKRMPKKYASLTPLCLACGVLDESGPEIVRLLLDGLADPNASADIGQEYLSMCESGWQNEQPSDEISELVGGRTPLHIACSRNDPYAGKIIRLLLDHSANPNFICNGQSPLTLAISSGNKEAIDLLLKSNQCDPNLPLTNGVGSALCVVSSTLFEHNWQPHERIKLIEKLIHYGADILQPIAFGPRRHVGSVVDYAYYMYNNDNRIAHTPYHSLTINERNTFNARRNLLTHLGTRYRDKILERNHLSKSGIDIYPPNKSRWGIAIRRSNESCSDGESNALNRRANPKFCYSCGRSVGIKLMACSRCKKVFYCSNLCKQKAWTEIHRTECVLSNPHYRSLSSMKTKVNENNKQGNKPKTANALLQNNRMTKREQLGQYSLNPLYHGPDNYSYN